jgi:hypothetical protein
MTQSSNIPDSPAYLIRQYLISKGLVSSNEEESKAATENKQPKSWMSFMPDEILDGVAFYDQPARIVGQGDLRSGTDRYPEHPGVQIFCRSTDYINGWVLINTIKTNLDVLSKENLVGPSGKTTTIKNVNRVGSVLSLGHDIFGKKRRNLFSLNVFLHINLIAQE